MKKEIINYMQVVESFYTDKLHKIKSNFEKQIKQIKKKQADQINPVVDRTELEKVFISALDELRKQILKRRLKQEIKLKNKSTAMSLENKIDMESEEAREFEESILKLVNYAKGRVKYEEFTNVDKFHLMELFVTNETTLVHIFQSLFPSTQKIPSSA